MEPSIWKVRALQWLRFWNDILLIPMFTILALEVATGQVVEGHEYMLANLFFCGFFLLEYAGGLAIAPSRSRYLKDPLNGLDFITALPLGYVFQGARAVRVFRIVRLMRITLRSRRLVGKGGKLLKAVLLVGSVVFAAALAFQIVEPGTVTTLGDSLWWAVVTLSTVGYGDIMPTTEAGKWVASGVILFGIGLFGYAAGFVTSLIADPEEDEILATVGRLEQKLDALTASLDKGRPAAATN